MLPVSIELNIPISTLALVLFGGGVCVALLALTIAVVRLYQTVEAIDTTVAALVAGWVRYVEPESNLEPPICQG